MTELFTELEGELGFTPHPGSRLDAVSRANAHAAPTATVPGEAPRGASTVAVHSDMPELCIPRTMQLSAINPVVQLLPQDMRRRRATIIAVTNPVLLAETIELAQNAATFVQGGGSAPTFQGTAYIPTGVAVTIEHRDVMYAAVSTTASTSPVTVITERYAEGV